jgi:predicted amidohydrolase YtcJ
LACFLGAAHALAAPAAADLIIVNAVVRTLDSRDSRAEAVAISGGRITAVGRNSQIRRMAGPGTQVVNARGRLLLPGFNDSHVHFAAVGNSFSSLDLRDARSIGDVRKSIERYTRFMPKGRWILGGQWDATSWPEGRLPGIRDVDDLTPAHPVFLYDRDGRSALVNSAAIKLSGIGKRPDLANDLQKDERGTIVGIVSGRVLRAVAAAVPADHIRDWPAILETASNYAASLGVTSVQDTDSDDHAEIYRQLERAGKLKTRVYDCVDLAKRAGVAKTPSDSTTYVRTGCVKSHSDADEYDVALKRDIADAHQMGLQVLLHAIGPAPNSSVLDMFASLPQGDIRQRRFRIEHAHRPELADHARLGRMGIIASMQPQLFFRVPGSSDVFGRMAAAGAVVAFGSDAPLANFDPLTGIYIASQPAPGWSGIPDAVRAYTRGSAFAEFQDSVKGTIERGKFADLVVLSEDIFAGVEKLRNAQVEMTIVGGRIVYERDA